MFENFSKTVEVKLDDGNAKRRAKNKKEYESKYKQSACDSCKSSGLRSFEDKEEEKGSGLCRISRMTKNNSTTTSAGGFI